MIGRIGLGLLCFVLGVWVPAAFASELGATLPSIAMRGFIGVVELTVHGAVACVAVAAAWSLLNGRAHGPALARLALIALAIVNVQSVYWSVLPRQNPPGTELPLAGLAVAHAALWLVFLQRSARVRIMSGEPPTAAARLFR